MITLLAAFFGTVSLLFLWGSLRSLRKKDLFGLTSRFLMMAVTLCVAAIFALGGIALRGYAAFTYEELAAQITIEPVSDNQFYAHFKYPDGKKANYLLNGDELYVDAHILKWQPLANFIGLHTSFQLHRVTGRYNELEDEQSKSRTVYALNEKSPLDLFDLRKQFPKLGFLVDTEYGSATFIPAGEKSENFALMVSTSGLLIRKLPD